MQNVRQMWQNVLRTAVRDGIGDTHPVGRVAGSGVARVADSRAIDRCSATATVRTYVGIGAHVGVIARSAVGAWSALACAGVWIALAHRAHTVHCTAVDPLAVSVWIDITVTKTAFVDAAFVDATFDATIGDSCVSAAAPYRGDA